MRVFTDKHNQDIVDLLKQGGVGILRTDTLYGIVARADNEAAVERVYQLKHRNEAKSPIVLIGLLSQLFDRPDEATARLIDEQWPGKVSIIVPSSASPSWIRRDNGSVAYRLPADETLQSLLQKTGPLIAPSANPESEPPARNIDEATAYFGNKVDFYVDEGEVVDDAPSRLLRVAESGEVERLR